MSKFEATAMEFSDETLGRWNLQRRQFLEATNSPRFERIDKKPMWVFAADGERVMSRKPVEVRVVQDGDSVVFECERLHVFAGGASYEEAETSFHEQVLYFFRDYLNTPPDQLTQEANELRDLYAGNFEACDRD